MTLPTFRTPPEVGIDYLLRQAAAREPDKTALIDDAASITFRDLEAAANRLATALAARGLQAGDRAATMLPNCIEFIVAELAFLRLGLVKVPLNIRFAPDEVMYAAADCAPAVLVELLMDDRMPAAELSTYVEPLKR